MHKFQTYTKFQAYTTISGLYKTFRPTQQFQAYTEEHVCQFGNMFTSYIIGCRIKNMELLKSKARRFCCFIRIAYKLTVKRAVYEVCNL